MTDDHDRFSLLRNEKVFMVLSRAGKPIFCCSENQNIHNESHYADIMATAQALLSVSRCLGADKHLKSCKSFGGRPRTLYFLERPYLSLFVVSHKHEPPLMLKMQLVLLHAQILLLLPMSGLTTLFEKSPGYDLRKLLVGSEQILSQLVDSYAKTPSTVVGAYPMMEMTPGAREAMRAAVFDSLVMTHARFGVFISRHEVITNVGNRMQNKSATGLDHWDILLLINFLRANTQSLSQGSETLTTLCMPFFDSHGHFFSYIRFVDPDTVFVCLSADPIHDISPYQDACSVVKTAWERVQSDGLLNLNRIVTDVFQDALSSCEGDYHFVFKNSISRQYVWNRTTLPEGLDLNSVIIRYGTMRAGMFALDGESVNRAPLQAFRLEESDGFIFLAFASVEAELFMCMHGNMQPENAIKFGQHVRSALVKQSSFFFSSSL